MSGNQFLLCYYDDIQEREGGGGGGQAGRQAGRQAETAVFIHIKAILSFIKGYTYSLLRSFFVCLFF